jgi:hypothetical protein
MWCSVSKSTAQTFWSQTIQLFITLLADKHFSSSVRCLLKHVTKQEFTEWDSFFHYSCNQELALVNTAMYPQVPQKAGNCLTSWALASEAGLCSMALVISYSTLLSISITTMLRYLPSKEICFFDVSSSIAMTTKSYLIVIGHFSPCPLLLRHWAMVRRVTLERVRQLSTRIHILRLCICKNHVNSFTDVFYVSDIRSSLPHSLCTLLGEEYDHEMFVVVVVIIIIIIIIKLKNCYHSQLYSINPLRTKHNLFCTSQCVQRKECPPSQL